MSAPHNLDTERALLSTMMASSEALEVGVRLVQAADFYRPQHAAIFDEMRLMYEQGEKVDTMVLVDRLRTYDGMGQLIAEVRSLPASTAAAERFAESVAAYAFQRRLMATGAELVEQARIDPLAAHEHALLSLSTADVPGASSKRLVPMLDFVGDDVSGDGLSPWVVPGMVRAGWRVVMVATEGAGKTLLMQQIGICASQGVHPLTMKPIRPIRVMLLDLENMPDRIRSGCRPIVKALSTMSAEQWELPPIYYHQGGIDVRSRKDRADFERAIADYQPELICGGPIYKLARRRSAQESWEDLASDTVHALDSLRERYGFALMLEHHAPKGGQGVRDLVPFGSSVWQRWPELGLKLLRQDNGDVVVGHYREPRMAHGWPDELHRGRHGESMPWRGYWANGMGDF